MGFGLDLRLGLRSEVELTFGLSVPPTILIGLIYIGPEVCEGPQHIDAAMVTSCYHHCHSAVVGAVRMHSHVSNDRVEEVHGTFFCCTEEEGVSSFIHQTQIGAELV